MSDVHTEHCCSVHGCKYGNRENDCTVESGEKRQSFLCEYCHDTISFFENAKDEYFNVIALKKLLKCVKNGSPNTQKED
jgi:hypothetical protein